MLVASVRALSVKRIKQRACSLETLADNTIQHEARNEKLLVLHQDWRVLPLQCTKIYYYN